MIIKTKKIYVPYLLMIGNGFFESVVEINLRIDWQGKTIRHHWNIDKYFFVYIYISLLMHATNYN